ncbi:MAG: DUF2796 domain-containing protein [Defluviicoccus sp.]|nr:MAG: DUF2796 domain-containing protein [Defluviicoccus sp.]
MIRTHAIHPGLRYSLGASLLLLAVFAPALVHAETVRQHPPHVHGRGALNIVLDGRALTAELSVPADDLVGFEHPPRSQAEKSAIRSAVETLDDAARILGLPSTAACVQDDTDIHSPLLEGEHAHDEDGGPHGETAHHDADDVVDQERHEGHEEHGNEHGGEHGGHEEHAEFHVIYRLTCADPDALSQLTVGYFEAFARAQALAVQAVGPWGQTAATLTRNKPNLLLATTN